MQPAAGQAADHHRGPHVHIFLGVGDDDGLARGSAGGVQADNVLHGAGKKSKRVGVAQIALHGEGQLGDVFERANISGVKPALIHARAEELDLLPGRATTACKRFNCNRAARQRSVIRHAGGMTVGNGGFKN
jgi:hypothetical protein